MSVTCEKKNKKIKSTGEIRTYVYYHCIGRSKGVCSQKSIRQTILEEQVIEQLAQIHIPQDLHEQTLDNLRDETEKVNKSKQRVIISYKRSV